MKTIIAYIVPFCFTYAAQAMLTVNGSRRVATNVLARHYSIVQERHRWFYRETVLANSQKPYDPTEQTDEKIKERKLQILFEQEKHYLRPRTQEEKLFLQREREKLIGNCKKKCNKGHTSE